MTTKARLQEGDGDPCLGNGYSNLRYRCKQCTFAWKWAHQVYMARHPEHLVRNRNRERERRARLKEERRLEEHFQQEPPPEPPEDMCPGCGHESHTGWCKCGCLDDRTKR